jgi:exocyst complex component 2
MNFDREKILQHYNITDEFADEWTESDEISKLNLEEKNTGELSKYALLRELVSTNRASSTNHSQDEADPLGSTDSVVSVLQARGIDAESHPAIRNKYLVSSTQFEPRTFLRDVHVNATYTNLVNSLDYLESSITEHSEALRVLVESDYDRFVKSKSLLDSVFEQIKNTGFNSEHEWGLECVKSLLDDSNAKATVIMKPVMDNQTKEDRLKAALELIKKNKYLFNLPSTILKHIKNNDHDSLIRDYRRGKDMKYNENITTDTPDYEIQNKKITDRIWNEVEDIVDDYKRDTWKLLERTGADQNYIQVISKLLELGVEDNPIWVWIDSQISRFTELAGKQFDKLKLKTTLMRMNLTSLPPSTNSSFVVPLKENSYDHTDGSSLCDSAEVVEMWLTIKKLLGEISTSAEQACMFWESCHEFLDNQRQGSLPTGYQGESKVHLQFSQSQIREIKENGRNMIKIFADRILEYFNSPAGDGSSSSQEDEEDGFLFLPPSANALSTVKYLSQTVVSLAASMKTLSHSNVSSQTTEGLTNVLSAVRERALKAVCTTWQNDSKKFHLLENWTHAANGKTTQIPHYFKTYQYTVINGIKSIMYYSAEGFEGSSNLVVAQPPRSLLDYVLSQFLSSNSYIFESLMGLLTTLGDPSRISYIDKHVADPNSNELTPQEKTNDSKVLLLLSNVSTVRDSVLPGLYKAFEQSFSMPTRDANTTLRNSMDQMDSTLFEIYTRKKRSALSDIIRNGIGKLEQQWSSEERVTAVSNYVHESLLVLVVVHSKVSEVSASLVDRIMGVLYDHIMKTILSCLRDIEAFPLGGLLQVTADVEFFNYTMKHYQTNESQTSIQHIYSTLKEASTDVSVWKSGKGPTYYVKNVVEQCAQNSRVRFRHNFFIR